jgi:hypothetical protein
MHRLALIWAGLCMNLRTSFFHKIRPYLVRTLNGESITGLEIITPPPSGVGSLSRLVSYEAARDEAGEVVGISVAVVDITERRSIEESLREGEDNYRVECVLDAVGEFESDTRAV